LPTTARSAPAASSPAVDTALSYCARDVRRYDNDRFLTSLFAPADRREAVFALLAFNIEIAKTREVVTEPMIGQIRLQWWRDAIDSLYQSSEAPASLLTHEVVRPLAEAITRYQLDQESFIRLIEAREADLSDDPPACLADLEAYAEATGAPLLRLVLESLGLAEWEPDAAKAALTAGRAVGIAWALTGLLRAAPFHLRQRRVLLPADLLAKQSLSAARLIDWRPDRQALAPVVMAVVAAARVHLAAARTQAKHIPAAALPALLPATLADLYLDGIVRAGYDIFSPRHQVRHPLRPLWLAWRVWRRRY